MVFFFKADNLHQLALNVCHITAVCIQCLLIERTCFFITLSQENTTMQNGMTRG